MFDLPVMIFISIIMSIIHIALWHIFPLKMRDILLANPIFAFLLDLGGAGLIENFTGVASFVGICNLIASVVFGVWAYWYGKHKGIKGLGIDWYKAWKIIPFFPRIMVQYQDKSGNNFVL